MHARLGTHDCSHLRSRSIRLRPAVVAAVTVVALALPVRALADGSTPTAAELVQQATSALSTADQTGLPAGVPQLPDPTATPAIPADPTGGSSSTPTPPPPPAGTDPAVPVTAPDPPAGPSEDIPASVQTAVPNAVSAISPPVPTEPDTTPAPVPPPPVDATSTATSPPTPETDAPPQAAPAEPPDGHHACSASGDGHGVSRPVATCPPDYHRDATADVAGK